MNPIMGKLNSGVMQLLASSAAIAKPGETAAIAGDAVLPFAALLSQMAGEVEGKSVAVSRADTTRNPSPADGVTLAELLEKTVPKAENVPEAEASAEMPSPQVPAAASPVKVVPRIVAVKPAKIAEAASVAAKPDAAPEEDSVAAASPPKRKALDDVESEVASSPAPQPMESAPILATQGIADVMPAKADAIGQSATREMKGAPPISASRPVMVPRPSANSVSNMAATGPGETPPMARQIEAAIAFVTERPRQPNMTGDTAASPSPEVEAFHIGAVRRQKQESMALSDAMSRLKQSASAVIPDAKVPDTRAQISMAAPLPERAKAADVAPDNLSAAAPQVQPAATATQTHVLLGTPAADLSASLGQQVIDMGSGGQWIDGLAREIAALSKGEGHGSFRLSPEHLGPMRVDIRPGEQGSNVTLTVETKAAETMLMQDRNILKADAQLAAVKIGDVTVERVPHVHEPSPSDTATGQGTGGQPQSQTQTSSQGQSGQNPGNAALSQGQSQQNGNHGGNRKVSADPAVSSQAEPRDAGSGDMPDSSRRARYA
ncbi:MAG: flagellar hook-length control protein FliK [Sphingobium sp.]|uniref:flagellar hook-length control protein FliK n=1 Tax=Sphingobium sp. TaxID=1912891 RepID=UPI0029A7E451|nr:flagellar hook-length control protein FliK [Sphingobium sp.]MDX3909343.1 flagellar hook-length control protein FliK [Sphingobium sp.]